MKTGEWLCPPNNYFTIVGVFLSRFAERSPDTCQSISWPAATIEFTHFEPSATKILSWEQNSIRPRNGTHRQHRVRCHCSNSGFGAAGVHAAPMMRSTEIARPIMANEPQHDAVVRLTPLGWTQHLVLVVVLIAASFFLCGYFVDYWRNADMDFVVVYNALAMNDGRPQAYFDHPAFISILAVKLWFQLLHQFGLLGAWKLSSIPSAADVPAFDAAMTNAIRAGRLLAWIMATVFVLAFAALTRVIVRDWRIAILATCAFAFSGGVEVHVRTLRSEMIAASFVIFALMILIIVARRATAWRPLAIAGVAALCVLGLENKVQAILLIGALPFLALPFGSAASKSVAFWRNTRSSWLTAGLAAITAGSVAWAAWPLIATGFDRALLDAAQFHPLFLGRFGVYQTALLVLIVACIVAFAMIWGISAAETLASIFAIAAGALIALLALNLEYNADNVIAVCNPLEKMLTFADATTTDAANGAGLWGVVRLLMDGVASVLARYTFVLHSSPRPTFLAAFFCASSNKPEILPPPHGSARSRCLLH